MRGNTLAGVRNIIGMDRSRDRDTWATDKGAGVGELTEDGDDDTGGDDDNDDDNDGRGGLHAHSKCFVRY